MGTYHLPMISLKKHFSMNRKGDKEMVTRTTINSQKQNKPTLVVADMARIGVDPQFTYHVLLKRGIFKWLAGRKQIIKLKNTLKDKVRESISEQKSTQNWTKKHYLRGYRKAMEECRKELRLICHQSRWTVQPDDRHAKKFLRELDIRNQVKS